MTLDKTTRDPELSPSLHQTSSSSQSFPIADSVKALNCNPPASPSQWNSRQLGLRLAADAGSAVSAASLTAPLICLVDRSIVEKASTNDPFLTCFRRALLTLRKPHHFLTSKPFLLILSLYTSTYLTANTIDTVTSTLNPSPASTVHSGAPKFIGVSTVNMSLCIYKDSQYAKLFGSTSAPATRLPLPSYLLFACRDSLTILASFNLPPLLSPRLTSLSSNLKTRDNVAQFVTPAAMQIFSTPMHLLGLDLYNRQGKHAVGWASRWARVKRDWGVSALARMGRIVPAYGVGGVVNREVRRSLMGRFD